MNFDKDQEDNDNEEEDVKFRGNFEDVEEILQDEIEDLEDDPFKFWWTFKSENYYLIIIRKLSGVQVKEILSPPVTTTQVVHPSS